MKRKLLFCGILISISVAIIISGCSNPTPAPEQKEEKKKEMTLDEKIERGKFLTTIGACQDCHSPKLFTDKGPVIDSSRMFSGSPEGMKLPKIDQTEITPGKWYLGAADLTAWVGPWGISYAVNLTPDSATGTGAWSEDLFVKIFRTGKFMGVEAGRPIMPPMPWEGIAKLSDEDLKCIFHYLQSLPAIKNQVPAYVPPNEIASLK